MRTSSASSRRCSLLLVTALAAATLEAAPAAVASPLLEAVSLHASGYTLHTGPGCTQSDVVVTPSTATVVENGPAVSVSATHSATFGTTTTGDTGSYTGTASGTGKVTSRGGNLAAVELAATATGSITKATDSPCRGYGATYADLRLAFTVTQAGFLRLTGRGTGTPSAYLEVYGRSSDDYFGGSDTKGFPFDIVTTVFLPPGDYEVYLEGGVAFDLPAGDGGTFDKVGTVRARGVFTVAGSRTTGPDGPAKRYVTLPASRSCEAHTLRPTVTTDAGRARRIQSVTFFVDGTQVKRVVEPRRAQAVTLRLADTEPAAVRTVVTLKPTPSAPATRLEARAAYAPCT